MKLKKIGKLFGLGAALVLVALAAGNSGQMLAESQVTPGHMASVWLNWPTPLPVYWGGKHTGFYNFDVYLTILKDPGVNSYYYWAHQFHFKDGEGGYMGLQTNGLMQGKWVGKMAIFSIWNAKGAKAGDNGSACEYFTGEGEGWSCRIPYKWVEGRTYHLRIWELCCAQKPLQDEWWGAWVTDTTTGQGAFIGQIQIPASWQWLNESSVVWVEYYGSVGDCSAVPYAKARFERPTADNRSFQPRGLTPQYGRTCKNARITAVGPDDAVITLETGGNTKP